jgi:AraC-like DNA-binding protein
MSNSRHRRRSIVPLLPPLPPAPKTIEELREFMIATGQQPVFNLTRSIALLEASAQSDMAFGTEQQPYPAGEGIRTSFLAGGSPFTPLTKGVSDSYTDLVRVDEGFYLRVIKDSGRQTTHVIVPGEDWLKISFGLEGGVTQTFNEDTEFRCIGGRVEINLHPPGVIKVEGVDDGCWGSSVALYLSRNSLKPHVEGDVQRLPKSIQDYLRDGPKDLILETVPMTGALMRAVVDIVNTRFLGRLRHTYIKAKALELLCETVYLLTHESELTTSDLRLSWRDKRQLDKARQTIRQDCVNAPTISELSRQLGLNQRKLKMGFKQLFGTPVFQYTQNLRLEKALQLLQTGDYSIREVADAVGYGYAKNFTTAFKKRYGVSPKVARKSFNRQPAPRATQ